MKACPHCKGTSGFSYTITLTTERTSKWDGSDDSETDLILAGPRRCIVCADCSKPVRPPRNKLLSVDLRGAQRREGDA